MSASAPQELDTYWVKSGKLLAGQCPGAWREDQTRRRLRALLEAGVTFFLDLTEAHEYGLRPYAPVLQEEAVTMGFDVKHRRMPIPDMNTPTVQQMVGILDTLDAALEAGHTVYVHCYAGIGRTGTAIGCHLARHGMEGSQALDQIARLREDLPNGRRRSPETAAQRAMVRNWPMGK
jgi:predicted protein tyrosine phosphatase